MSGVTEGHGRYQHWKIKDFGGGYIDGVEDNLLPENASKNCNGVISEQVGALESVLQEAAQHSPRLPGKAGEIESGAERGTVAGENHRANAAIAPQ